MGLCAGCSPLLAAAFLLLILLIQLRSASSAALPGRQSEPNERPIVGKGRCGVGGTSRRSHSAVLAAS